MGFILALLVRALFPLVWFLGLFFAIVTGTLRWATPMRYAIGAGVLLAAVPPYVYLTNHSLLAGLFVLEEGERIASFAAMSMLAAIVVVGTFQAARVNRAETSPEPDDDRASEEEPDEPRRFRVNWLPLLCFFVLGSIAPIFAGLMTSQEYVDVPSEPAWGSAAYETFRPAIEAWSIVGVVIGLILAMLVGVYQSLVTHDRYAMPGIMPFEFNLRHSKEKHHRITEALARFPILVRRLPGGRHVLAPGVATLASLFLLLVALYVLLLVFPGLWSRREIPGAGSIFAAGFYVLLLVAIGTLFLGGLAFACDRWRVPTLLIVVLALVPAFCFPAADSYFALVPSEPDHPTADAEAPVWKAVFQPQGKPTDWKFPHKLNPAAPRPTMVVVVAPGGGIQAAAWTTQVLTGLDELYEDFSESIGLLSSVSGGSVGVMYYLVGRSDRTNDPDKPMTVDPESTGFNINWQVRKSSLDAVAWALSYPKAVRPVRLFIPTDEDHGWALKTSWHLRLRQMVYDEELPYDNQYDDRLYLRGWCDKIRKGRAPAFVFNATVIETGKRLTIAPVNPDRNGVDEDFLTLYPKSAPHLATAARLSAAFPYVSPSSRALPVAGKDEPNGFHIVDGGYADNEGIVTAVEWIQAMLDHRLQSGVDLPFDRVLILRLQPFHTAVKEHKPLWPLISTMLGPAYAMANARGASQAERGLLESRLLIAAAETKQLEKRRVESQNAADAYQAELAKARPNIQNSLRHSSSKPAAAPQVNSKNPENRQYGMAVQMAVADRQGWYQRPEVRDRLTKILAERVEAEDLQKFDDQDKREALRVLAFEEKSVGIGNLPVIPVYTLNIAFNPDDDDYQEPLSWKLTPRQIRTMDGAWAKVRKRIADSKAPEVADESKLESRTLKGPEDLSRFFKLRSP